MALVHLNWEKHAPISIAVATICTLTGILISMISFQNMTKHFNDMIHQSDESAVLFLSSWFVFNNLTCSVHEGVCLKDVGYQYYLI